MARVKIVERIMPRKPRALPAPPPEPVAGPEDIAKSILARKEITGPDAEQLLELVLIEVGGLRGLAKRIGEGLKKCVAGSVAEQRYMALLNSLILYGAEQRKLRATGVGDMSDADLEAELAAVLKAKGFDKP